MVAAKISFLLLLNPSMYTGAGIFVEQGSDSVPINALPNNGIIVSRSSGRSAFAFNCYSGSRTAGNERFIDVDEMDIVGSVFPIFVTSPPSGAPGSAIAVLGQLGSISPDNQGVYTCRMLDENGVRVDVNVGIYPPGFNSKDQ